VTEGRNDLPAAHAVGLGAVWLLNIEEGTLQWLDAVTGQLTDQPLPLGAKFKHASYRAGQVIVAEGSIWVAQGNQLLRIAPE
jgi:streptogramin lyase